MDERENFVKALKNAPKGTKLWLPIIGECELVGIEDDLYPIRCKTIGENPISFSISENANIRFDVEENILFP